MNLWNLIVLITVAYIIFNIYLSDKFWFNFAPAFAVVQYKQKTNKPKQQHILYFQNTLILFNEIIINKSSFSSGGSIFNFFSFWWNSENNIFLWNYFKPVNINLLKNLNLDFYLKNMFYSSYPRTNITSFLNSMNPFSMYYNREFNNIQRDLDFCLKNSFDTLHVRLSHPPLSSKMNLLTTKHCLIENSWLWNNPTYLPRTGLWTFDKINHDIRIGYYNQFFRSVKDSLNSYVNFNYSSNEYIRIFKQENMALKALDDIKSHEISLRIDFIIEKHRLDAVYYETFGPQRKTWEDYDLFSDDYLEFFSDSKKLSKANYKGRPHTFLQDNLIYNYERNFLQLEYHQAELFIDRIDKHFDYHTDNFLVRKEVIDCLQYEKNICYQKIIEKSFIK
jgi:hypothetical protein